MSVTVEAVTENVSAPLSTNVVCNCEGKDYGSTSKRWGWPYIHCRTCHADDHRACGMCGACMPRGARLDRAYCSSTCRGRARREREFKALERAAWEAEHPDEAAREAAEIEAHMQKLVALSQSIDGISPQAVERRRRIADLLARAERCEECNEPLVDVVYRRRRFALDVTSPVLPFCAKHRCGQMDGYHNRDAPPGKYYPSCTCDDRYWKKPEPCLGCNRLVAHPRNARWRISRDWRYQDESSQIAAPRVFCGGECKRRVLAAESRSRRMAAAAERQPVRCESCSKEFRPKREDARTCSPACRQKAYRARHAA